MSASRGQRVRLPGLPDGNGPEGGLILDRPPPIRGNTFSISYADHRLANNTRASTIAPQTSNFDSSEGEGDIPSSDDGESENGGEGQARAMTATTSPTTNRFRQSTAGTTSSQFQNTPHFSRTMSMPLPSQLTHLQHPHRPRPRIIHSSPSLFTDSVSPINALSIELADAFQMVIQTMLQISPPQLLESAKEQYSACSLSVPAPSMSAIFTAMKTLNYMSANLLRFYSESGSHGYSDGDSRVQNVFDIGELLQCIGDTLSGVAAQTGVDLVLYHGEVGLRHVHVKGDECGILYALLHIIRQILDKAHAGDLIELGLVVTPHGVPSTVPPLPDEAAEGRVTASPVDMESLRCTIKIEHKYGAGSYAHDNQGEAQDPGGESPSSDQQRINPQFTTLLLRRLLRLIDAQFTIADNVEDGQVYEIGLILPKTALPISRESVSLSSSATIEENPGPDTEPSVEQLLAFCETLKGRKVTLYANSAGSFTRHITSYLATWGMDVYHVSSDGDSDTSVDEGTPTPAPEARHSSANTAVGIPSETASNGTPRPSASENPPQISFVLIDDDVGILRERLQALRVEQHPLNLNARARPSLAALHRPRSSPQIARVLAQAASPRPPPVVVLHFTSLVNFKAAKDAIQSVMSTFTNSALPLPEVMIIPKPVGPRRFLTAIHTAVTRPIIDPFFLPTATSPLTPGIHLAGSFFPAPSDTGLHNPTPPSGSPFSRASRPHSSRASSDRSTKEHAFTNLPSPSPLSIPDNVEYFPNPDGKLGSSPSSGCLVSSPDGQPAGILFNPRSKKNASPQLLEQREQPGNQAVVQHHGSTPKLFAGDTQSFSALHEASQISQVVVVAKSPAGTPTIPATAVAREGASTPGRRSPPGTPGSEGSLSRRPSGKRPTHEKQDSIGKKGKNTNTSDGNIVPPISVLIVDDNPINQTILSTFMKRKKIRYGIANNGKEAVEKWKTGGFHLILMDIQMPIMDGIEATREIRRLEKMNSVSGFPPTTPSQTTSIVLTPSSTSNEARSTGAQSPYRSSVIIVALTASSLQSDRVSALAAGCNDFLTKPVSLLWLNNKIIEWGSIKALQMWADIRPDAVRRMSRGQAAQARAVADRLHMPKNRKSPSRRLPMREQNDGSPNSSTVVTASVSASTSTVTEAPESAGATEPMDDPSDGLTKPASVLDSVADSEWTPMPPIMPPKRRRSQKREKLVSEPQLNETSTGSVDPAHGAPHTPPAQFNGVAPVAPQKQGENDSFTGITPKAADERKNSLQQTKEASEQEARANPNPNPPPQSPVLHPR